MNVISLHIAYDSPRRIGVTIMDTTNAKIISNHYIKPPAFGNYLEFAIIRAKYMAVERGLSFSVEHVAIWLAHLSREDVEQAADRVDQKLFDEGYRAANDGQPDTILTHPKQRQGYAFYWQQPAMEIR